MDENVVPYVTDDSPNQSLEGKVDELLSILRPLQPFLASLPDLAAKVEPVMNAIADSPVLRMMGVRL